MAKKFRWNQLTNEQLGITAPGMPLIPITKLRVPLDDGTRVEILPPGGKAQFDDGDVIDIDTFGPPDKNKKLERHLKKDPRFTSIP